MKTFGRIAQVLAALGILNVWIVRFNRETEFRGGSAKNLPEEFEVYGLPKWMGYATGVTKISLALTLLAGLRVRGVTRPAATMLALLMSGAMSMHAVAGDTPKKYVPAATIFTLSTVAAIAASDEGSDDAEQCG